MRSWLPRVVALACLVAVLLVIDGGTASAAPVYELVSVDGQGAPLAGDTTGATASSDGHAVAFAQQAGDGCGASTISVRNRQARATTTVGNGQVPSITGDGTKVAFASCTGPEVSLWNGTAATPLTSGQWRQGGADTIKRLDIAPGGAVVAFTVGPAAGPATALWLAHADGSPPVKVAVPNGELGAIAAADATVAFVAGGQPYATSTTQPGPPTPLPPPGGQVSGLSLSDDGQTVGYATGDGVFVSVKQAAPALVTAGAIEPAVAPDGTAVAVTMANGAIKTFTTANPAVALSTASPVAAGGFSAPVMSGAAREVVFLAKPGSAAGATSANVQVYALGPSLTAGPTNFGDVGVGATTTKAVTFTNEGTIAITPTAVTSSSGEFVIVANGTTCVAGQVVALGQSCVVQVALTPAGAGARTATVTVAQQDGSWDALAAVANLTANAVNGELAADPSTLDFGSVTIGTASSPRTFTVTNSGTLATTIGTLLVSGGQASEFPLAGGTCAGATLAPAATCIVSVSFKPGGAGLRTASMDVAGSGGAAVSVSLSGTGTNPPRPALAASPAVLDFGEQIIGSAGAPQTVTVRNSGNVTNTPSVQVGGDGAGDFTIVDNGCVRSLSAGSSCTLSVTFVPTVAGTRVATLAISGTGGSSASVRLSGTARLNPALTVGPAVIVPGQVVTIAGTDFPAGVPVLLSWDIGGAAATAVTDGAGSFSVAAVVPAGLGSGTRRVLVASPPEAAAATAAVLVQVPAAVGGPGSPVFENSPAFRR